MDWDENYKNYEEEKKEKRELEMEMKRFGVELNWNDMEILFHCSRYDLDMFDVYFEKNWMENYNHIFNYVRDEDGIDIFDIGNGVEGYMYKGIRYSELCEINK